MKNDIDYELLEEKLKQTPIPNPKVFYSQKKGRNKLNSKSVVIRNILRKEKVIKDGKVELQVKTFNAESVKNALYYIDKEAEYLKNDNDNIVSVNDILKEWDKSLSKDKNHSEALHYVFSIDEYKNSKNYEALERSVRDTLSLFFSEYKYAYAIHKHQNKPHVHVIINKHNIHTNRKFTFKNSVERKNFFYDMRENFKDNLNNYNENFNYKNYHRVEKNLVHLMMKDELKLMTMKNNFIKEVKNDTKKDISVLKDFHNQIEATRKINFEKLEFTTNPQKALKNINKTLQKDSKLDKQAQRAMNTIKLKNIFASNLDELTKSDSLIDFQNHINYFESSAQKRMMSLRQYKKFDDIRRGFNQFKFDYDKEFKNKVFIDDKENIKFLSTRTNSWHIDRQLKLIGNRKLEYAKLYNNMDKEVLQQLDKNYTNMIDLFKARANHVNVLIKDYESQLKYENNTKKYQSIEKSIKTLKNELKFVEHIQSKQDLINLSKQDHKKFVHEFINRADKVTIQKSAFTINKLIIEAEHHKTNSSLSLDDKKQLDESIEKLHKVIKARKSKVFNNIETITNKILNEKDNEKKEKLKEDIHYFKKEYDFVKENYKKDTVNQSNKEKDIER